MRKLEFSKLETDAMSLLLSGDDAVISILRDQYYSAKGKSREYTGVGYFLIFDVAKGSPELDLPGVKTTFCFGDVGAKVIMPNSDINIGFLLWIKEGYLDFLEVYTYGNDSWPENIQDYSLFYFGNKRNMSVLNEAWKIEQS